MKRVRLEVCVDTLEGLETAVASGADRIELCSCLNVGGLTPSFGLMRLAATLPCETRVIIRPREGDFVYSKAEVELMFHEIDAVASLGLEGVALGANLPSGHLDENALRRLTDHARDAGLKTTLHRSFDLAPDLIAALSSARDLGLNSILTSGGAPAAHGGMHVLRDLAAAARTPGPSIDIMAGVGVTSKNVRDIIECTQVNWVHGSCGQLIDAAPSDPLCLGLSSVVHRRTSGAEITRILQVLTDLAEARNDLSLEAEPGFGLK
jgi:copper homeostasis protein